MRWILTFTDGKRYETKDPPLSSIPRPHTVADINWISLDYNGVRYSMKLPECIVCIDDCRWGMIDVRPVDNIIPIAMYRAKAVLGINSAVKTRESEFVFLALGCEGLDTEGQPIKACLRVYPDGRAILFVEREAPCPNTKKIPS